MTNTNDPTSRLLQGHLCQTLEAWLYMRANGFHRAQLLSSYMSFQERGKHIPLPQGPLYTVSVVSALIDCHYAASSCFFSLVRCEDAGCIRRFACSLSHPLWPCGYPGRGEREARVIQAARCSKMGFLTQPPVKEPWHALQTADGQDSWDNLVI